MKIEIRPLASITQYARNPRRNQSAVATVKASLKEYGWRQPIVVDAEGVIIAGHTRYLAALELGWTDVPVHVAEGLTPAQIKAYRIMDNRSHERAEWDMDLLALEMEDLKALDFDLDLTGFSTEDLAGIEAAALPHEEGSDTEPQIDRAEELCGQWGVETGQLWQLGEHRLLCGDSTKAEDVGRVLQGDVPFLCVTDPPYGVSYEADWRNHAFRADGSTIGGRAIGAVMNDDQADWSAAWKLFPGDVIYSWHPAGATSLVHAAALQDSGFKIRMQIIWAKNQFPIGRGDYHVKHEPCWYCVRNGKSARFTDDRTQTTLWEIDKPHKSETGHSTQKPLECMARPMRNHHAPEVYEPFSGSGTTIIAGENLGRKVRAIELSPAYVAVALQRWADHTGKMPTLLP